MELMTYPIDDYLGPRQDRFFGEGFKRVVHDITDLEVGTVDGREVARANASLHYPVDWSRKSSAALRPHLSTIDALVLATQLSEVCLTHAYGLDGAERRRMWLADVEIRAGLVPQADLSTVAMEASHTGALPSPAGPRVGRRRGRQPSRGRGR